ncbi:MAG: hypothetical protein GY801_10410, partial [bacterium]|nr:hypothetical protein [bacterium]
TSPLSINAVRATQPTLMPAVFSREEAVTVIELIDHDTMQTMTGSPEYVVVDAMT